MKRKTGWTAALAASGIAAAAIWTVGWTAGPAAAESKARERLAANFEIFTLQQAKDSRIVPAHDQKRVAKCLAAALAADIPDPDADRLSAIFEGRAKGDLTLQKKWLTISAQEAPARNAQVLGRVDKLCADLGPYVKGML